MRKLIVALVLVLVCSNISVADEKYGEHTIHAMNYDKHAVEQLLDGSEVPAEVTADERGVREIKGKFKLDKSMKVEDAAIDFIDRHRNAFKLKDPKKELKQRGKEFKYGAGFQQIYNGILVWQKGIGVSLDKDHDIREIDANLIPTPDIDTTPLVTEEEALAIAERDLGTPASAKHWHQKAELIIYTSPVKFMLAYRLEVGDWVYFVNARDGSIIGKESSIRY